MRLLCSSLALTGYTGYVRHCAQTCFTPSLRMIGVVSKVFADRGYGFALTVAPPLYLLKGIMPVAEPEELSHRGEHTVTEEMQSSTTRKPLSVWFSLSSVRSFIRDAPEQMEDKPFGPPPSPGTYVKFSATCHYDSAKREYKWRVKGAVVPCDVCEELRIALQTVRDVRWDRITLEDVEKEKRRVSWQSDSVNLQIANIAREDSKSGRKNLCSLGWKESDAEEAQAQLAREVMNRQLCEIGESARRFVVREEDLRQPLQWMRRKAAGCGPIGVRKDDPVGYREQLSEDEQQRWMRVLQFLRERRDS